MFFVEALFELLSEKGILNGVEVKERVRNCRLKQSSMSPAFSSQFYALEVLLHQLFYGGEEPPDLPNLPERKRAAEIVGQLRQGRKNAEQVPPSAPAHGQGAPSVAPPRNPENGPPDRPQGGPTVKSTKW